MPIPVILNLDGVELSGELFDTPAGQAMAERLPMVTSLSRWGEEYYGYVGNPVGNPPGDTQEVMEIGDLAFWAPGNAFCVFFGPTPASRGDEPRAASDVHRIGSVSGNFDEVRALGYGVKASLVQKI